MLTWLKSLAFMAAIIFMVTGTYLCFYTGFLTVFLFFFFFDPFPGYSQTGT